MSYFKKLIILSLFFSIAAEGQTLAVRPRPDLEAQRSATVRRQRTIAPRSLIRPAPAVRERFPRSNRAVVNPPISRRLLISGRVPNNLQRKPVTQARQIPSPPAVRKPLARPVFQRRASAQPQASRAPSPKRPISTSALRQRQDVSRTSQSRHCKGSRKSLVPSPTPQEPPKAPPSHYVVKFREMPVEYQTYIQEICAQKGSRLPAADYPTIIHHNSVKHKVHGCLKDLETNRPHLRERLPQIKQEFMNIFEAKGYRESP